MTINRERKVRLGAAVVLAVVFGAGVAIGLAARPEVPVPSTPGVGRAGSDRVGSQPDEWIVDQLGLTSEQQVGVDSVVAFYGRHMSDLQRTYRPRFRSVVDSTNRALMEILTEDQRAHYDSIQAVVDRRGGRGDSTDRQ